MSMFDHIGLRVKNLDASVRFYQAALAPLGFVLGSQDKESASFGPPNEAALYLYANKAGSALHVALKAPNRAAVDKFHAAGVAHGGKDNGKPGVRADYSPNYYAAFLTDPDGNNLEAVVLT